MLFSVFVDVSDAAADAAMNRASPPTYAQTHALTRGLYPARPGAARFSAMHSESAKNSAYPCVVLIPYE